MTTFYICRHGQTENNKRDLLSGWIDTPLTDAGIKNTESSAAKLSGIPFDKVFSSDLGRAFISAYLILRQLGSSLPIEIAKGLREVNYGDLANKPPSAYPHLSPEDNSNYVMPGGESLAQMQQRVLACVEEISSQNPDKTILLVAHDGTINAIHSSFTGEIIGALDAANDNPNDFVAMFTFENGKVLSYDAVSAAS